LVRRVEATTDVDARESALELFQSLMELHGAGLERMLSIAFDAGDDGRRIVESFARDDLVSSLLLLYGLHPLSLESRVAAALEKMRPSIRSRGGAVGLLGIADGVVRLRLEAAQGCSSSSQALKAAVEEALYDAAPDAAALEIETAQPSQPTLVQLKSSLGNCGVKRTAEALG
ncbi:MAG TPA: NifU family protein, partial [Blastocatellia bacterium]